MTGRLFLVLGNGDLPPQAQALVPVADCVIRFNDCRSAADGPVRTDIVAVCNTGRPGRAMALGPEWRERPPVRAAREIWCVRDGAAYAAMRPALALTHPELDDFCDDYTDDFARLAAAEGKSLRVIDPAVTAATRDALAAHDPEPYVVPSSGLITLVEVLAHHAGPQDRVMIAGFGHVGWDGHPFAAERRLVEAYIAAGRLTRVDMLADAPPIPPVALAEGA